MSAVPEKHLHRLSFEEQYEVFVAYFLALKEVDGERWGTGESSFYKARVVRALLRLLPDIVRSLGEASPGYADYIPFLEMIDPATLDTEAIRAAQGSAGIKAIYDQIHTQVFPQKA